ncbi:MAG TPA: SpoIID/LytB domain-containing protein, partial [Candidatus Nanopelagicales bacterium]
PGMVAQRTGAEPAALPEQPEGCTAPATRWRARAVRAGLRLDAACGGRWRTVQGAAPAAITFAGADGMVATQNGTVRRAYRGTVTATRLGSRAVAVVNTVAMEDYLRAVVPSESSPSWPDEALKAQAVAARSYAAREARGRAARSFDVYDTTRSQAYPGAAILDSAWRPVRSREHPRSDAAIAATAGLHVTVDGVPALTQFGASNGGATAASPLPYMTVQTDPWDARAMRNPRLAWTHSIAAAELGRRARVGQVTAVEVLGREGAGPWGGRLTALRIVGTSGARTVSGDGAIRSMFGTASSMFTFTPAPAPAAS